MKIVQQAEDECVLATIANLADVEYPEVREHARAATGGIEWATWNRRCWPHPNPRYIASVCQVLEACGILEPIAHAVHDLIYLDTMRSAPWFRQLPRKGRGFLTIGCPGIGHVMAWENGRAFDSGWARDPVTGEPYLGRPEGETLGQLLRRYRRARLDVKVYALVPTPIRKRIPAFCQ